MSAPTPASRWTRVGLFALPLYAVLRPRFGTLAPQPDPVRDPEGWARFVSSTGYLVAHVATDVVGAVLVVLGTYALGAFLLVGAAPRPALTGMVLSVVAQVLFMVPGTISTFATPAIGAAYLAGSRDVLTMEFRGRDDGRHRRCAAARPRGQRDPRRRHLAVRRAPPVGGRVVGRGGGDLLPPRGRPRHGDGRREPAHAAGRRRAHGRRRWMDGLERRPRRHADPLSRPTVSPPAG